MRKSIYAILGIISFILGSIGTIVPLLPTVPFYLLATYCLARSSKRLNDWFKNTKFYQENLQDLVVCKAMSLKAKVRIMASVTLLMFIGFVLMGIKGIIPGCIVLFSIWVFHVLYFTFVIKTLPVNS